MAQITFTISDAVVQDYIDAFCATYDYDAAKLPDETRAQFARRKVKEYMQDVYRGYTINTAVEQARIANQDATIDIT